MPTIPDPDDLLPLRWRRRIYAVLAAAVPLAIVYGADELTVTLWLAVAGAALGFTAATNYTRTPGDDE